jgi:hypothetical protein
LFGELEDDFASGPVINVKISKHIVSEKERLTRIGICRKAQGFCGSPIESFIIFTSRLVVYQVVIDGKRHAIDSYIEVS